MAAQVLELIITLRDILMVALKMKLGMLVILGTSRQELMEKLFMMHSIDLYNLVETLTISLEDQLLFMLKLMILGEVEMMNRRKLEMLVLELHVELLDCQGHSNSHLLYCE